MFVESAVSASKKQVFQKGKGTLRINQVQIVKKESVSIEKSACAAS